MYRVKSVIDRVILVIDGVILVIDRLKSLIDGVILAIDGVKSVIVCLILVTDRQNYSIVRLILAKHRVKSVIEGVKSLIDDDFRINDDAFDAMFRGRTIDHRSASGFCVV